MMEFEKRYGALLPFWDRLTTSEREAVIGSHSVKRFSKGSLIDTCYGFLGVITGTIKVYVVSEEGREITLYKAGTGECGVMATRNAIKGADVELCVIASEDTELLLIGAVTYSRLTESNVYVRSITYEILAKRMTEALWVMKEIVFSSFDRRLASYLVGRCEKPDGSSVTVADRGNGEQETYEIRITQDAIAEDVNSAREVVARMLKRFALSGYVELKRGSILVKDIKGLRALCD